MVKSKPIELESTMNEELMVGTPGCVVTAVDALDATDVPAEVVAVAVNVYTVLLDNPDTVIGEDVPVPVKPPGLLVQYNQ